MLKIIIYSTLLMLGNAHANQTDKELINTGQKNFETLCLACHNATSAINDRVAPPMIAIIEHYLNEETSMDEFIQQITVYINNPKAENSQMPGAIRRFGLMPKMGYTPDQIKSVGEYLYNNHNTLPHPKGYSKKHNQRKGKKNKRNKRHSNQQSYLELGQQLALSTKAKLGKSLMFALNKQGTEGALGYCNEHAIELTDTAADDHQVKIKRVSDRNRNPNNQANQQELNYILRTQEKLKQQQPISGQIIQQSDTVVGYYPITTNSMCLQCHGLPDKDISKNTMKKIQSLYPNDQAINYGLNELRGIWVIELLSK